MNSIPCDVVILPNPLLADKAITASQKLASFNSLFTLKDGECYPHASLYMLQLKIEDLSNVQSILEKIASAFSPLLLKAARYDHTMGFIDAEYEIIPELASLQEQVIQALNPIRDGMREKDKTRMQEATGLKLKNFQNYGYPAVGELFRPHITLSRLKENNQTALQSLGDLSRFDGVFLKIGLFEMGDNGTCVRKIHEVDF